MMKAILSNIKENLFDAPEEVKKAFNEIVKYFDKDDVYTYGLISDENFGKVCSAGKGTKGPLTVPSQYVKCIKDFKVSDKEGRFQHAKDCMPMGQFVVKVDKVWYIDEYGSDPSRLK